MKLVKTALDGLVLLEPGIFRDDRGFFMEAYKRDAYLALGVTADFVQDNHSRSVRATIRGLHYQRGIGQPKLVRVVRGTIFDVALDIRPASPTFGQYEVVELDDLSHRQLYIPEGFAHGFCVTSDVADVVYKVGSYYDPAIETGIAWDDVDLKIPWPVRHAVVSPRDASNPTWETTRELLGP
jgi:dTDP-4-dehydrorhamnose 3,5-epimerase